MIVLPDREDALRIAAFLDEHDGWSAFWDRRYGVWRVSEDDPDSELYAEDADAGRVIGYMSATAGGVYDEKAAHAEREANAAGAAAEIDLRLIAFMLPAIPESVRIARFHVRAALGFCELGRFAADAAIITSELVTNAVQHARCDVTETVRITLARASGSEAVIIAVSDSSPHGPVMRDAPADSERGWGLRIVESLCVDWGWHPEPGGKAVFAILAGRTSA
jgi:anti-sigma regulatory factor (Ser/Thr protein kinase)